MKVDRPLLELFLTKKSSSRPTVTPPYCGPMPIVTTEGRVFHEKRDLVTTWKNRPRSKSLHCGGEFLMIKQWSGIFSQTAIVNKLPRGDFLIDGARVNKSQKGECFTITVCEIISPRRLFSGAIFPSDTGYWVQLLNCLLDQMDQKL